MTVNGVVKPARLHNAAVEQAQTRVEFALLADPFVSGDLVELMRETARAALEGLKMPECSKG